MVNKRLTLSNLIIQTRSVLGTLKLAEKLVNGDMQNKSIHHLLDKQISEYQYFIQHGEIDVNINETTVIINSDILIYKKNSNDPEIKNLQLKMKGLSILGINII